MTRKWVIEARDPDGKLDFTAPQPEAIFGMGAILGMTDDQIAKVVYARGPADVVLRGDAIATWPTVLDPRFRARPKTW